MTQFFFWQSSAPWADPLIGTQGFQPKYNELDGNVERRSHEGLYRVFKTKRVLNFSLTFVLF